MARRRGGPERGLERSSAGRRGAVSSGLGRCWARRRGLRARSTLGGLTGCSPKGFVEPARKSVLASVKALNEPEAARTGNRDVTTRLQAYAMAARMQTSVPELSDLSKEHADILAHYGAEPGVESFANNCLLARRLVERGVRFVQLMDGGWDHHYDIPTSLKAKMRMADKPIAALLRDLSERGLLQDTLVVFCGEFGRTRYCEGPMSFDSYGRDRQQLSGGFLLAGGGVRRGTSYGETDE